MNLAMFHDWIIWQDGQRYFLDDAFFKFVTAFDRDFDRITFCGRVASQKMGDNVYPLNPKKHRVCPFPYYENIYTLSHKGLVILPQILYILKKNLDQWDLVWLPAPHPIGVMAACLCRRQNKPFFFLVRQNLQEQVRHRNTGLKRTVSVLLVHVLEWLSQKLARKTITFTVGQEMLERYRKKHLSTYPVIISLISEQDIAFDHDRNDRSLKEPVRLLSIGRLDPEKGLKYLIQAVDLLTHTEKKHISLTIAGKGKAESALKKEVRERGLSKVITFLGYVRNGPELLNLYREHDFFILPSLTGEGLPQTLLEAMACAIPIIATTVAGIPYVVKNRVNGLLIPPETPEAICQAVLSLMSDYQLRNRIIQGGLRTVSSHTLEIEKEKMMNQIRSIL